MKNQNTVPANPARAPEVPQRWLLDVAVEPFLFAPIVSNQLATEGIYLEPSDTLFFVNTPSRAGDLGKVFEKQIHSRGILDAGLGLYLRGGYADGLLRL